MRPGGRLARGGETAMSVAQAFSVRHRADLLAACPPADCDEMRAVVLASLNKVAGGWPSHLLSCSAKATKQQLWCISVYSAAWSVLHQSTIVIPASGRSPVTRSSSLMAP